MQGDVEWSADRYAANARFVSDLGQPVLDLLAPRAGERVLDLGCGDGVLSRRLIDAGCDVVGIDSGPDMVAAAVRLGVDARIADGHALDFVSEFDAVFSNAALHWMREPDRVIDGVWRALKPGGRFVGECGGHGNVATFVTALEQALARRGYDAGNYNPWHFASARELAGRLERRGFAARSVESFARPTPLPGDVLGWLETFARHFTAPLPASERPLFLAEVARDVRSRVCDERGLCVADYVRLRFTAVKPACISHADDEAGSR